MARIAFFTEKLPPDETDPIVGFSYDLICSLADQQHEVRVLSTYREEDPLPPPRPRVDILRPFRKWNWLEVPRVIPALLEFRPEILHVIQPRAESLQGFTNAMTAVPGLVPLLGKPALITSFYDLREESLKSYRPLLLASDAVTVMSLPQRDLLARFYETNRARRNPALTVLPAPVVTHRSDDETTGEIVVYDGPPESMRDLVTDKKLVFVPGDIGDHRAPESVFELLARLLSRYPEAVVVFGGGWGKLPALRRHSLMRTFEKRGLGARVLVSGPLSASVERWCLDSARVVFTASLPTESLRLTRLLRDALHSAAPIVMASEQAKSDPLPWQDRMHSFIAGSDAPSWEQALADALESDEAVEGIRSRLPEFSRSEAVDQPGNVMSRVYSSILERRR